MSQLISIVEYAKINGINPVTMRQRCERGNYKTAHKLGRDWVIDKDERYEDNRVKSGKYRKNNEI